MSPVLTLYRAGTILLEPFAGAWLKRRLRQGKEDGGRLGERVGRAGLPRPPGPLVWVHGASVGESLSVLPLVSRLAQGTVAVLVTTGTVTSAGLMARRLPRGALHQFLPLDIPRAVGRFLDHWRPAAALMAESELWPNTIAALRERGIPLALVNGRMSARSFERWRRVPRAARALLGTFDLALVQTTDDAARVLALGARHVEVAGNLKFDTGAPPADAEHLAALTKAIGSRPVWLAASTSADEEPLLLEVQRTLLASIPDLLAIVAPRQVDRGRPIADAASAAGLRSVLRSAGELPDASTQLYLADTMGELGLFYRAAPVVLVGKSLAEPGGGQNPLEPAAVGCAILHGRAVANFAEIYRGLDAAGGALPIEDADTLVGAVRDLLADRDRRDRMAAAALRVARAGMGATDRTLAALRPLLERAGIPAPTA